MCILTSRSSGDELKVGCRVSSVLLPMNAALPVTLLRSDWVAELTRSMETLTSRCAHVLLSLFTTASACRVKIIVDKRRRNPRKSRRVES